MLAEVPYDRRAAHEASHLVKEAIAAVLFPDPTPDLVRALDDGGMPRPMDGRLSGPL
jgi:hypothetical protein